MEQKNQGRTRLKITVFVVLAIHGIGCLALLMQGCQQKETPPPPVEPAEVVNTNTTPTFDTPSNPPATTAPSPATNPATTAAPAPAPAPATTSAAPAPSAAPAAMEPTPALPPVTGSASDYKVAKGDTFGSLSKKFHVSIKAISDANPGVQSSKLKIGQTLHIPASAAAAPAAVGGAYPAPATTAVPAEPAGGEPAYSVKSGDTLTKIANHFGVSLKTLRSANSLKTDRITVGQKLKIPAKASAPAPAPAAPAVPETPAPAASPTGR